MPSDISEPTLRRVIQVCYDMLELADHGDKFRQCNGCGVVYGSVRDAAYKIRKLAEKELESHDCHFKITTETKNSDTNLTTNSRRKRKRHEP